MIKFVVLSLLLHSQLFASADFHTHLQSSAKEGSKFSLSHLLSALDEAGIDKAVVLSSGYRVKYYEHEKAQAENDFINSLRLKNSRLIAFCGVPLLADWALEEIKRCRTLGIKGIKLHPLNEGADLRNQAVLEKFRKIAEYADQEAMTILLDSDWLDSAITTSISTIAMKNKNAKFIFAHAFFTNFRDMFALASMREFFPDYGSNLYVDISATIFSYRNHPERDLLEWNLRYFGLNRVLFGSDYPLTTPKKTLEALQSYTFTPKEINMMMNSDIIHNL